MTTHQVDLDRLPFYGLKAPTEVRFLKKHLQNFEVKQFAALLKDFYEGSDISKILAKFVNDDIDKLTLAQMLAGLHLLYHMAIRQPRVTFKSELFRRDLEDMGFSSEHVAIMTEAFSNVSSRSKIEAVYSLTPPLPKITAIGWRVDIAISSPDQPKLLAPVVTLILSLSNRKTYAIQLDMKSFHKLRLSIAQLLHEMQLLEKRPIMKPFISQ